MNVQHYAPIWSWASVNGPNMYSAKPLCLGEDNDRMIYDLEIRQLNTASRLIKLAEQAIEAGLGVHGLTEQSEKLKYTGLFRPQRVPVHATEPVERRQYTSTVARTPVMKHCWRCCDPVLDLSSWLVRGSRYLTSWCWACRCGKRKSGSELGYHMVSPLSPGKRQD